MSKSTSPVNIRAISTALSERARGHKIITTDLETSFLGAGLRFCEMAESKCDACKKGSGTHGSSCVALRNDALFIESVMKDCGMI